METLIWIGLGGFFGAMARYGVSLWASTGQKDSFPWGTFLVNVGGCLLIGFLMHMVEVSRSLNATHKLVLVTGFLGSLTTFSTFGYETLALLKQGNHLAWMSNVTANLVLGLAAVWVGQWLAGQLPPHGP